MSDSYDWTMGGFSPFQSGSFILQSSAPTVSEPAMLSDHLRYNNIMQHPFASVDPDFDVSLASASTFSNLSCSNPNHIHLNSNDHGCAPTSTTIGYPNPMQDTTFTDLPASILSVQETTQSKAIAMAMPRERGPIVIAKHTGRNKGKGLWDSSGLAPTNNMLSA